MKPTLQQMESLVEAQIDVNLSPLPRVPSEERDLVDIASGSNAGQAKEPELIETVIKTLGRLNVLDAKSRKALRLTCTAFRDLVDSAGFLSKAVFHNGPFVPAGLDALAVWARGGPWTPRTRFLVIGGEMPRALAKQVVDSITTLQPPIENLMLAEVGSAGEAVLTAPKERLRVLRVVNLSLNTTKKIAENKTLSNLQSLHIDGMNADSKALATVLTRLPELKHLGLRLVGVIGADLQPGTLKNCLKSLESLEIERAVGAVLKMGILTAEGPELPALRNLKLVGMATHFETGPWMSQLTALTLSDGVAMPGAVEALNGGQLQELDLDLSRRSVAMHWDWDSVDLPHLTRLSFQKPGGALNDIVRAKMPKLSIAELPFHPKTSAATVKAMSTSFPELSSLALMGQGAPSAAAVKALSREEVPHLETFYWSSTTVDVIVRSLLPSGPVTDTGPRWPRLRCLGLRSATTGAASIKSTDFYTALARSAPHSPALSVLTTDIGITVHAATVKFFVAAAKEVESWPLLKRIHINYNTDYSGAIEMNLREAWPAVQID